MIVIVSPALYQRLKSDGWDMTFVKAWEYLPVTPGRQWERQGEPARDGTLRISSGFIQERET